MELYCKQYDGKFSAEQQAELLALLWDYMREDVGFSKRAKLSHRVATGYGSKTQAGLLASIEGIVYNSQKGQVTR